MKTNKENGRKEGKEKERKWRVRKPKRVENIAYAGKEWNERNQ